MYSKIHEWLPASGVEVCTMLHFVNTTCIDVVCAIENYMRIYQISPNSGALTLLWEERAFGRVAALAAVPMGNGTRDRLLVSFDDAKAVLFEWNEDLRAPIATSLHHFERDTFRTEHLHNEYKPMLRIDPVAGCAAIRIYKDFVGFVPLHANAVSEEEHYKTFVESWVVPWQAIDARFRNVIDFVFLPGFAQTTLGVLYETTGTFVGRLAVRRDTVAFAAASVDLVARTFTLLYRVERLPHTSHALCPIPRPIGGVLVAWADGVIHVDAGYAGFAVALNAQAVDGRNTGISFRKRLVHLGLQLERVRIVCVDATQLLLVLRDGAFWRLILKRDAGRFVSDISIERVETPVADLLPTDVALFGGFLFVASRLSDSVLLRLEVVEAASASSAASMQLANGTLHANDDVDDALFGASSRTASDSLRVAAFPAGTTLVTLGPMRDATVAAMAAEGDSHALSVVGLVGCGKATALCVFSRRLRPHVRLTFEFPVCTAVWSFAAADRAHDRFLMLSTAQSTLIMELRDDEFNELPTSGFFLEGATIFAASLCSHCVIVQVHRAGFVVVANDASARVLHEFRIEGLSLVVAACVLADALLLLLVENGSILAFDVKADGTTVPRLFDVPLPTDALCMCACDLASSSLLAVFTRGGAFRLLNVTTANGEIALLFADDSFGALPLLTAFNATTPSAANSAPFDEATVCELMLVPTLEEPTGQTAVYLLVKTDVGHTLTYRWDACRRVLLRQSASYFACCDGSSSSSSATAAASSAVQRTTLVKMRAAVANVGTSRLHAAVFSLGDDDAALWFVNEFAFARTCGFSPAATGSIACLTAHHSALAPNGFIYVTRDGRLTIATLDASMSLEYAHPHTKRPLNTDADHIAFHLASGKCAVATFDRIPTAVPPAEAPSSLSNGTTAASEAAADEDAESDSAISAANPASNVSDPNKRLEDEYRPAEAFYTLKLYSPLTWEPVDAITLEAYEVVTALHALPLAFKQAHSSHKEYIAVTTSYHRGEDRAIRGRCLLLDVVSIVPDPSRPHANHRFKRVWIAELKGPATACAHVNGCLLIAVGSKIMVYAFGDEAGDETLEAIAFLDVNILTTCISTCKSFVWLGDVYKAGLFCVWQEEPPKLVLLGRDGRDIAYTAVDFMLSGSQLYLLAADVRGNVHVYFYAPHSATSGAGSRLVKKSQLHVGGRIGKFVRFALNTAIDDAPNGGWQTRGVQHGVAYFTVDGAMGVIVPEAEKPFKRMQSVFARMTSVHATFAHLSPRTHRVAKGDASLHLVAPFVQRTMLDGDLMRCFCALTRVQQRELVAYAGTSLQKVFADFAAFYRATNNKI